MNKRWTKLSLLWPLMVAAVAACGSGATGERTRAPSPPAPKTDELPDSAFRFLVKGDWGAGTSAQSSVTAQMCSRRAREGIRDVVTTGDNFYRPDGVATQSNYFRPESCLLGYAGHQWRAVWGNHDLRGRSTLELLGAERYYTWSAGSAQFFMLDSNRPSDRAQRAWLAEALRSSSAPVKVAVLHHPPFSVGTHESNLDVRAAWVPLFERYGVSLVLSGHNHVYEHAVISGVHYVVSGGGGAGLYRCERQEVWVLKCEARHHFLLVELKDGKNTVTALDPAGAVVDSFAF